MQIKIKADGEIITVNIPDPATADGGRVIIITDDDGCYADAHVVIDTTFGPAVCRTRTMTVAGQKVLKAIGGGFFDETTKQGKVPYVSLDTRPWAYGLIDNCAAIAGAVSKARMDYFRAKQEEADAPFIARENALVAQIPEDCERVDIQWSWLDQPIPNYFANGVELSYKVVTRLGQGNPNADGGDDSRTVAYAKKSDIAAAVAVAREKEQAEKERREAREKELLETPVPEYAVDLYKKYNGSAAKAWEQDDTGHAPIVAKWAPYIEAQGLAIDASTQAAIDELNSAARETPTDY